MILINSATVDFYELQLDGNIHFIGTQGTGKSTLLRAILFFYNADARKLGISKEKTAFSDYYFPYVDSYLIYEVSQGTHNFCVWLYKKRNRLCFRFIDGPYSRELFIDKQRARSESQVIEQAIQRGYKVHRPIHNFTEYRDIIYGANKGMNRFHVLQNPAYQNIPRTISNIFLNSSLDGGFIKTTIINSLSDEPVELNLDANRHHIETARNDYRDVSEYLLHEKKAQNIVSQYDKLVQMEEDKKELAWQIGASYNLAREKERELVDDQKALRLQVTDQQEKIDKINAEYSVIQRRIQDKLSVVTRDIKKTNQLVKGYASKNIQQVLDENEKKQEYETEQSQVQAQLALLTSSLKDVESQYQIDRQRLETQCQQHILDFEISLSKNKGKLQQELTDLTTAFFERKEKLAADHRQKLEEQNKEKALNEGKLREVGFKIENIQGSQFLKEEQDKQLQREQGFLQKRQQLIAEKSVAEFRKESTMKEGKRDLELLELKNSQESEALSQKKQLLEKDIDQLQSELQALSGSLLEFLEQNKPDWGQMIGKVISRDVLLSGDLQPSLSEGDNVYGLNLDLEQRQPIKISKSELEIKLESFKNQLVEQNKLMEEHHQ
ncbi:MAG TPA: ATP-binding protein, partial [Sunxiuqinia sp.]|nr:ATP-binding protein [Sunxiuqinia sp.]